MTDKPSNKCSHEHSMAYLVDRYQAWRGYECPYCKIDTLQRALDQRNEQIDGYERQLRIDQAGAERTIGSEIERLMSLEKVADDLMRERSARETCPEPDITETDVFRAGARFAAKLAAVTKWLEANQPDVFQRGLWDAINDAETADLPLKTVGDQT